MKLKLIPALVLALVFVLSACGPAAPATDAPQVEAPPAATEPPAQPEQPAATEPPAPAVDDPAPTEEPPPPVPTSRGANLEATDPSTVALASGQLQLVEFFRFT
ncbi:MAG: hypothetical protein Kow002_09400 [Anaerolineales bacterium]